MNCLNNKATLLLLLSTVVSIKSISQLTPLSIGSIAPRDSVVVLFEVTIATALPAGTSYIANQGTVAGSNFSSLVTDDPETVAVNDSTKTPLAFFTLPVNFITFKANQQNGKVNLEWKVAQQVNVDHYEVERSGSGGNFVKIGEVPALNILTDTSYFFTDQQPLTGNNFYRVRSVDVDAKTKYTNIININLKGVQSMAINPNPVKNGVFNVQLNNMDKGRYEVLVYNSAGQMVSKTMIDHSGGSRSQQIILPPNLPKAIYNVLVKNGYNFFTSSLLVQ